MSHKAQPLDNKRSFNLLVSLQVANTEHVNSRRRVFDTFVSTKQPSCRSDKSVVWSLCLRSSISSTNKNLGGQLNKWLIILTPVEPDARVKYDKSGYSFSIAFKNLVFPRPGLPTNKIRRIMDLNK